MKTKLIQIKDYLFLIDEETEINKGWRGYAYKNNVAGLFKHFHTENKWYDDAKIVLAYRPLTSEAKELDLPMLPNPFKEVIDVENLARKRFPDKSTPGYIDHWNLRSQLDFIEGYKAAQSKQFGLEDMKKSFNVGERNGIYLQGGSCDKSDECDFEEFIQSLSTQQLPKEFIPEYKNRCCGRCDGWKDTCVSDEICPEHKVEGCEICYGERGNQIKTITNTEGKEELAGVYKYYP